MTGSIGTLFSAAKLEYAIEDGLVRVRPHPDDDNLVILNYTEKAQYEKAWNEVTLACRGLIVDYRYGTILGRSWPKFFNYGEHPEGTWWLGAAVETTDKVDGSLGIMYRHPKSQVPAIATRGSFESEQAIHATAVLRDRYLAATSVDGSWTPLWDWTYLWEIVYPANRIVLDYHGTDDLILLGAVHTVSGRVKGPDFDNRWPGPRARIFPDGTLGDALSLLPRENAEGVVVRFKASNTMVKIKQEDYVRLHKIVTGLSERGIWEHLSSGAKITDLLEQIPDEFHEWVTTVAAGLIEEFEDVSAQAHYEYGAILDELLDEGVYDLPSERRKEFAQTIQGHDLRPYLFMLLDGRDLAPAIWKAIKPVGHRPMTNRSEDVA